MNQKKLLRIINDKFLNISKIPLIYLIKGEWGIGKTFFWNEFSDIRKSGSGLKFIRVSLFGIESIDSLDKQLKIEYLKIDSNIKKSIQQTFKAINTKWIGGQIDILQFITLNENVIVCFDDIERKSEKLSLKEVMGFIENISLNSNVFLLMNEAIVLNSEEKEMYLNYKEKIIDFEYELTEISDEMCDQVLSYSTLKNEYKKEISKVFQLNKQKNYRVLIKIERFVQSLLNELKNLTLELVNICSNIIIEETIMHSKKSTDSLNNKTSMNLSKFLIREELIKFLKTNQINLVEFNRVLYPNKNVDLKVQKANEKLIEYIEEINNIYLKNEKYLIKLFSDFFKFIKENSDVSFDVNIVLDCWKSLNIYYPKLKKTSNKKIIDIDTELLSIVLKSVSKMDISNLENFLDDLVLRLPIYNDKGLIPKESLQEVEKVVRKEIQEKKLYLFERAIETSQYESASTILKQHPKLILEKMEILDALAQDCIEYSQYTFIHSIAVKINDEKIKEEVRKHLYQLENDANDFLIKERLLYFAEKL